MDEKQKQAAGHDPAKRAAAEGRLRQALVGMAKAKHAAGHARLVLDCADEALRRSSGFHDEGPKQ